MWTHMMDWGAGWGAGAMFGLGHLLAWAVLIALVIVGVRWMLRGEAGGSSGGRDRALSILRERYARGEIDKEEFDARRRDLS